MMTSRLSGNPIFTIGHSTRSITEFVALLRRSEIEMVVDVRIMPRSRTNPQYNREALSASLADAGIGYEHIAALGGLRGRNRDVAPAVNDFWENDSFHNFADYAMGDAFRDGFTRLRQLARGQRCAVMCSEAVWWRCHRRIIADYLIHAGDAVFHIIGAERIEPARMTPSAKPDADDVLTYRAGARAP
ncbi:MAG TPA: DUF488 domain-containing protein [Casimicrobiaceae bacterium]|nr:DUF488 domain-containing protein [Casimicrobiaceae bacterium]